jgi:hypothetical protein
MVERLDVLGLIWNNYSAVLVLLISKLMFTTKVGGSKGSSQEKRVNGRKISGARLSATFPSFFKKFSQTRSRELNGATRSCLL